MPTQWSICYLLPSGAWSGAVLFADAQIVTAARKLVNQGLDTCQISFSGARPPNVGPLTAGTVVRVLRDDADGPQGTSNPVGWFTGTVVAPRRTLAGNSESATLTLNGPWDYLARCVYQQLGLFYSPAGTRQFSGDVITNTSQGPEISFGQTQIELSNAAYLQLSSDIILTQAQSEGVPMGAAATLQDALSYALDKGARFTVGTLPADQAIPSQTATDQTCADMLKKVLRWLPSVVSWFDYSMDPPALHFAARADRPPLTLQMGGDVPQVQSATLQARPDLVLPGVTLQYLRKLTLTTTLATQTNTTPAAGNNAAPTNVTTYSAGGSTNSGYITTTQVGGATTDAQGNAMTTTTTESSVSVNCLEIDTAGPDPDGIGAMVATVQLQGGNVQTTGINTTPFEPTPVGLAAFIYAQRSILSYEGTVGLKGQDLVNLGNPLASTLNIAGGDDDWTAMAAEVQTTTENTATGATSLQVGPPNHLGASDLAALLQANRLRQYVDLGTTLTRNSGGAGLPPSSPLPPNQSPPGGNPPGSHAGAPSNGDGETQMNDSFSGILETHAGTVTTPPVFRACTYGPAAGPATPLVESRQDPPRAGGNFVVTPGGANFMHSLSGGDTVSQQENCITCYPGGSYGVGNIGSNSCTEIYTQGTLDLSGLSALSYSYAELRGTVTFSKADGTTGAQQYQIPVTGYLGLRTPGFRVYCPGMGENQDSASSTSQYRNYSQSLTMDGGLFVIPRES